MQQEEPYWFAAKRYGRGWGLPQAWQGRLVLLGHLAVVVAPSLLLDGDAGGVVTLGALLAATALLVWVCWRKGEPPDTWS